MSVSTVSEGLAGAAIESAAAKKELERELIKSLAGCYTVTFSFVETFSPNPEYQYRERYLEEAQEYAFVLEESEDKIIIQHVLYAGPHLIKHWRQDWIYENRDFLTLVSGHTWRKTTLPAEQVAGTWTQNVYQVDDTPRYQGYGTWVHVDGRHFWQSFSDAPIPRRDSQKRQDYNVLKRRSHLEIFQNDGWVLDQDNTKVIRADDMTDTILVHEKGIERLTPKDFDPQNAIEFFEPQRKFWEDVRAAWDDVIAQHPQFSVSEHKKLYTSQFRLASTYAGDKYDQAAAQASIRELFDKHVSFT